MPLLFYAQFPEPLPDQALFGEQAHEGPNCVVLAESVRAYCAHLRDMAAGRGTAPSQRHKARKRARLVKLQADAVEVRHAVRRGALVDAEAVAAEWSGFCARFAPEC